MAVLCKPKYKPKGKPTCQSKTWHIRFWCRFRKRPACFSTGSRDRRNAERKLRAFLDILDRGEYDGHNPFLRAQEQKEQAWSRLRMPVCLTAYEADLRAGKVRKRGRGKPPTREHADLALARLRRVVAGVPQADGLLPTVVASALDALQREQGFGQQTRKHHERAVKAFSAWLCESGRMRYDPLAGLRVSEVAAEQVLYPRAAFSHEQVEKIVAAAATGPTLRGLSGPQRSLLWLFLAGTGFRVREAAAVRRCDFSADCATVRLSGLFTKNDKAAQQPLPHWLQQALVPYVATLAEDALLWPGGWEQDANGRWRAVAWMANHDGSDMLRVDAAAAGLTIGKAGMAANGGVPLDCHSFRHYFATAVGAVGVSESLARKLVRASSAALLSRYTHHDAEQLAAAVAELREVRRAT